MEFIVTTNSVMKKINLIAITAKPLIESWLKFKNNMQEIISMPTVYIIQPEYQHLTKTKNREEE